MTTRPGRMAEDSLRYERGKRLAHCLRIRAIEGTELLFTDHDRPLTVEARTYNPAGMAGVSADRREGGLRAGDQEVRGLLDGSTITLPQMHQERFRGATVHVLVVDWARPHIVYSRHTRVITTVVFDGSSFVGTLEGVTQHLTRPTGGRFGGHFSQTCQYELGNTFCKADISGETVSNAVAGTVVDPYLKVQWTTGSFGPPSAAQVDGYYRDGSIVWKTGDNVGQVSPIVNFTWSTRECELLIPTLRPIQAGDTAEVKPGCNGLYETCETKFSNQANFGGSDLEPTAGRIREPLLDD